MELIAIPLAFTIWYLVYDAKPSREDEIGMIWEEEDLNKRIKIQHIISKNS